MGAYISTSSEVGERALEGTNTVFLKGAIPKVQRGKKPISKREVVYTI